MDAQLFRVLAGIVRDVEQEFERGPDWSKSRHEKVLSGVRSAVSQVQTEMLEDEEAAAGRPERFGIGRSLPEGDR